MFGKTDDLTIIKTLTSTLNDSVKGYRDAAEHVDAPHFRQLFTDYANERERVSADLQGEVRRLGGETDTDGTAMGSLHQAWLDLKAAVTGRDDKAIINEVERGEDYLKEKFEAALAADGLTGETRDAIDRAWTSVSKGHDQVSQIKHSLEA